jgi:hypothetical protein
VHCPFCEAEAAPRALHSHLEEAHPGEVVLTESPGRLAYRVTCPRCGARYEHSVKGRGGTSAFVAEHAREIRLVGFDMLVNHLIAEHASAEGCEDPAPAHREEES